MIAAADDVLGLPGGPETKPVNDSPIFGLPVCACLARGSCEIDSSGADGMAIGITLTPRRIT